jgi:hypothetical protein
MKSNTLTIDKSAKISEFSRLYEEGLKAWSKAGEVIVELVEDDPNVYDEILAACPMLTPSVLSTFEKIGRGLLYAPLAMDGSPGGKRLQSLPLSQQVKYESEPLPLIVHTDSGTDVLRVRAKDMTKDQAAQVFANGRVRTEGEQKAYLMQLRSMAARPVNNSPAAPWSIKSGRVIFQQGASLTAGELAMIVAQLTK